MNQRVETFGGEEYVVRNVTGCPLAGVCHDEGFDITPYAHALA